MQVELTYADICEALAIRAVRKAREADPAFPMVGTSYSVTIFGNLASVEPTSATVTLTPPGPGAGAPVPTPAPAEVEPL